ADRGTGETGRDAEDPTAAAAATATTAGPDASDGSHGATAAHGEGLLRDGSQVERIERRAEMVWSGVEWPDADLRNLHGFDPTEACGRRGGKAVNFQTRTHGGPGETRDRASADAAGRSALL